MGNFVNKITNKALKSICKHKVAAIGFNKQGKIINCKFNRPRFGRKGGGVHAELEVIKDLRVRAVVICRINKTGKVLPLHPCAACKKVLNKLGISVRSIEDLSLRQRR